MKIRCIKRSESGTNLPEVVLAVGIIALTATALIYAFNYGFVQLRWVRENQRATQIILERTETVRLFRWDQVTGTTESPAGTFTEWYDPQMTNTGQGGIIYTCTVAVADAPAELGNPNYAAAIKKINVTLNWRGAANIPRTRTFYTFVARDGQQNYLY